MSQPVVFIARDFFIQFLKELSASSTPGSNMTKKKKLLYFEELIFQEAIIFINIDEADIHRLLTLSINEAKDEDERIFCLHLQKLSKINKLHSCKNELEIFRQKVYSNFSSLSRKPHFILLADTKEFCLSVQKEFGVICVSTGLEIHSENTRVELKLIDANTKIRLSQLTDNLPPCNHIVVEDPHLLNQKPEFVKELIETFLKNSCKIQPLRATLIFNNNKDGAFENRFINKLKGALPNIVVEIYKRSFIHDRNIYSNTFWLSCDYGFMNKYNSTTKWSIYPIGTYYQAYHERKERSVSFIRTESSPTENYLISKNPSR